MSPFYEVEVANEGREVYHVEAPTEDEAHRIVTDGGGGRAIVEEVTGGSVESVHEIDKYGERV